jgi:hypothetical protein
MPRILSLYVPNVHSWTFLQFAWHGMENNNEGTIRQAFDPIFSGFHTHMQTMYTCNCSPKTD